MIRSFRDADTEALAGGTRVSRFAFIENAARRKQYRLCFRWTELGAEEVEIVDHHRGTERYAAKTPACHAR
ncbi:MAG: hypothetical protein ABMA00_04565 [Gemmatimonas sp.]